MEYRINLQLECEADDAQEIMRDLSRVLRAYDIVQMDVRQDVSVYAECEVDRPRPY